MTHDTTTTPGPLTGVRAFFTVWAPNAIRLQVVGDFNNWNNEANSLRMIGDYPTLLKA